MFNAFTDDKEYEPKCEDAPYIPQEIFDLWDISRMQGWDLGDRPYNCKEHKEKGHCESKKNLMMFLCMDTCFGCKFEIPTTPAATTLATTTPATTTPATTTPVTTTPVTTTTRTTTAVISASTASSKIQVREIVLDD